MFKIIQKYKHEFILAVLICIYIVYFTTASFLRYDNFYTGRFDLGNMDQTVWNTINGRIFQTSDDNGSIVSRLSVHADFILIFLAPLYLIWPHAKMLLLTQTFVVGTGAIFIYLIANIILKNKTLGLAFAFLFLMNPAVQYTNLYDFHAVTIATTTLLAAFYFLLKRKYFLMIFFLILSGITKEQVWAITAFFGLPLLLQRIGKIKLLGASIVIVSLVIFGFIIWYAIPQNFGREHFALSYYSDFGDTPTEIIKNIIISPHKLINIFLEESRLDYLKQILMPLGFTSLLSPFALLFSLPDLLIGLLSNNSQLRQIYYQYTSAITPFIFISSIFAVKNINKWFPKIKKYYVVIYLVLATFFSSFFYGPLPYAKKPNIDMFIKPQQNKEAIEHFLSKIPQDYSIAATNNLGSHVSHRQHLFTIPVGIDKADVIMFLLNSNSSHSLGEEKEIVNNLKNDKNYIEVFKKGDFVVFKKRSILL